MPKKKGGKMANMTEEERIIFMEQQRLAEEEMRKTKEDMLTQFLKNKLAKEEKATRFNLNKLDHQWRTIMREAKSKELKKDLEILSQTFERVVDRKESVIKSLGKDLLEAEEQYSMALRSHLQNVDYLIDLQRQRIEQLRREFCEEQSMLVKEFESERELITVQHQLEMRELQDIMYAMEQNFLEKESDARGEFQSQRDELKNKNLEDKHALRIQLEAVVEDLWGQFTTALRNYQDATEERKKAFEELKAKDERSAKEIDMQMRKLQRITDKISQVKSKIAASSREFEDRNKNMKEEREALLMLFQDVKSQMNRLHSTERERLVKLTIMCDAALKDLKAKSAKCERILKLAEMCRRLETEEEKVLPFYVSSLTDEEKEAIEQAVTEEAVEPLSAAMFKYAPLENFWKRYNKVLLDRVALEKERSVVQLQNQQLRMLLKQYLDGISVNDEILNRVNPLFIVNNRTNIQINVPMNEPRVTRRLPQQLQQPTVIEAAHVARTHLAP
jgi:hypothetical protein